MITILEISEHPIFGEIKRKVELLPLTIDYKAKIANWPFQVVHANADGVELIEVPRANGNFRIDNTRKVNAQTGVKLSADATEEEIEAGVPEFEFLRGMLMQKNVDPLVLGSLRISVSDQRGNFNDYSKLMEL